MSERIVIKPGDLIPTIDGEIEIMSKGVAYRTAWVRDIEYDEDGNLAGAPSDVYCITFYDLEHHYYEGTGKNVRFEFFEEEEPDED